MIDFSDIDLYPVTGRSYYKDRSDEEVIAQLAKGGAKIVQLREKNISDRKLYELALLYRKETSRYGMLLIINDRADIAKAVEADGVHLGRDDMPIETARKILGPDTIIGASSHNVEQALEAEREGATYVNIGPLFTTPTKPGARTIGLEPVRETLGQLSIPLSVMGGIVEMNLMDTLSTGVRHIGMVTAVFGQDDIAAATKRFVNIIRNASR
ncbi:Thiamin-phosphate pyrophosphorylase [hydrothermal vent metagenome]|uniref:thiamine phosphate synthase n=1 Tax=hydrothermal vent metagenome TaxID=652676 RepID=A0A3B1C1H9_9ZZZZ